MVLDSGGFFRRRKGLNLVFIQGSPSPAIFIHSHDERIKTDISLLMMIVLKKNKYVRIYRLSLY